MEINKICKNPKCKKRFTIAKPGTKGALGRRREFHSDQCRNDYYANLRRENQINDAKALLIQSGYFMSIVERMKETTVLFIVKHDLDYRWDFKVGTWVKQ